MPVLWELPPKVNAHVGNFTKKLAHNVENLTWKLSRQTVHT
jgi:hypothetical protein